MLKKCIVCDREFNAKRATAKFCNPVCRVKYSRQIDDDTITPEPIIDDTIDESIQCPECGFMGYNPSVYNSHAACFLTQEQIEQHFTLANYPCNARYYGVTGSGYGSLSPYKATDPRHQAYLLR